MIMGDDIMSRAEKIYVFLNKLLSFGIFLISIFVFVICVYMGYNWYMDGKKTENATKEILDNVAIDDDSSDGLNIDFTDLMLQNSNTVGWVKVENTNINYPVVQASDNDYYLTHSFDNTYNEAGWVFLDYRNDFNNLSKNNIIYAHSRLDQSMFGTLKHTLKSEWYSNSDNHIIKTSSTKYNYTWEVFSTYIVDDEVYYLTTGFDSNEEYITFLENLKNRSVNLYNVELSTSDKILTLSTCYGDTQKMVLHAKLIKTSLNTNGIK